MKCSAVKILISLWVGPKVGWSLRIGMNVTGFKFYRNEIQFQKYPALQLYEHKHEKACFQLEAGFLAKV
jgi:hypothetical protein